jgi:ribonuclease VapC
VFIDTSAFIAILAGEPQGERLARAIGAAPRRATSAIVRLETCMRLATKLAIAPGAAQTLFDEALAEAKIDVMPVSDDIGRLAAAAFEVFGKGRGSKAQLNLADCLSYACAKSLGAPILFGGGDFASTDLESAAPAM